MNKNRILILIFVLIISFIVVRPANAWTPGGCNVGKDVCFGPVVAAPGIIFDFNGRLQVDAFLGAGYEVRFLADKFYSVGGDVLADFDRSESGSSSARISLAVSVFKAIRVGMGLELREGHPARGFGIFGLGIYFENPV